jgi:hypothetical protein
MSDDTSPLSVHVDAGINHICNELGLIPFVRAKCIEMSSKLNTKQGKDITKSTGNAIACAIVSIVHEESKRKGRVDRHLPDRIIGEVFGQKSVTVVYNKRLLNSVIGGDSARMTKITG